AQATEDLHRRVAGENTQSADIILAADVPLLRGAGSIAREDRIQAERDVIYAARTFARFRRDFLFQITRDYLDLIVIQRRIANAEQNVDSFEQVESRQRALFDAGRSTPFDLGQAENETLDAVDRLDGSREDYRVALDQFKSRIGFPIEEPLVIEPDSLGLPTPLVSLDDAVRAAMSFRLDLQTQRDTLDDSQRGVDNARNLLLGDLRLVGSVTIPTDPDKNRGGVDFEPGDAEFEAGITYGLPLDRELERVNLREAQIGLERSRRAYERVRDNIAIQVRAAVRGIDSAQFSFEIQEASVAVALQREASIRADPARATIRDKTEAINQTVSAQDARDRARRDLEVAILFYLLESGQLRVDDQGHLEPLAGMEIAAGNGATGGMNGTATP
ncbi:MAG: TolC family protein, partial [Planctomycetota bacterium]